MSRAQDFLRDQFIPFRDQFAAFVEGCSDSDWRRVTGAEGWPVGVTVHHVAATYGRLAPRVHAILAGAPSDPGTLARIHEANAGHAVAYARTGKAETLAYYRQVCAEVEEFIAGLGDEEMAAEGDPFGTGERRNVEWLCGWMLIGHPKSHLKSIRATLAG